MNVNKDYIELTTKFLPGMKTNAKIYVDEELQLPLLHDTTSLPTLQQMAEVCSLPGIVGEVIGLPDIHKGYGFPIGCVAALDGYVSPGGVGYDINCGVRGLRTNLSVTDIKDKDLLADVLYNSIPTSGDKILDISLDDLNGVLDDGMDWLIKSKYIPAEDAVYTESNGKMRGCSKDVLQKSKGRGLNQLGSIGYGNHYVEVQVVDEIYDNEIAKALELELGQIVVMVHTGSRGLGHSVCHSYLLKMHSEGFTVPRYSAGGAGSLLSGGNTSQMGLGTAAHDGGQMKRGAVHDDVLGTKKEMSHPIAQNIVGGYRIDPITGQMGPVIPVDISKDGESKDQLICCSLSSDLGKNYLSAMGCAANYAFVNRSIITQKVREAFKSVCPRSEVGVIYDVCHNIAKPEMHCGVEAIVHRKGASRAFPPLHPEVPEKYASVGQPVMIGGSMGTCSYIVVGQDGAMEKTYGSTCHGAGRVLSRRQSKDAFTKVSVCDILTKAGVTYRCGSEMGMVEEAPGSYKDITRVVDHSEKIGLTNKVCKVKPYIVVKG